MTDRLLTIDQAAELLQVSAKTVRRAIERGELAAVHVGEPDAKVKTWRIRAGDLEAWVERRTTRQRRDSGRSEQIAPVIAAARTSARTRRRRPAGVLTVEAGMGR